MSTYDLLMLAIVVAAVLFGAWKGLAWQVASFSAIVVSYFAALNFREPVSQMLQIDPPWNKFAAMLILFVGCSLIIWTIFSRVKTAIKKMHMGGFDRQAGALLGAFKGALLCMVVTMFAVTLLGSGARQAIMGSRSGGYLARGINRLTSIVPDEIHQVLNPYVQDFNEALVSEGADLDSIAPANNMFPAGFGQPIQGQLQTGQAENQNYQDYTGQWQTPPIRSASSNNQQPGANGTMPTLTTGENGFPDLNVTINSKDLIDQGFEAGRNAVQRAMENRQNNGQ